MAALEVIMGRYATRALFRIADPHPINHFAVHGVGARYAAGRPYVHDAVVRAIEQDVRGIDCALDLGAGTGLSSRALLRCASRVIAVDPAPEMLAAAFRHRSVAYVCAVAERLPLADGCCDLVSIGSAFHWCEPGALVDELDRVTRDRAWLLVYDLEFAGFEESTQFIHWIRSDYWRRLPRCPHHAAFDAAKTPRFSVVKRETLVAHVPMTVERALAFFLSQASSINAVSAGHASAESLESQLRGGLQDHIGNRPAATTQFDLQLCLLRKAE
jgi:SAM-dependent methyltransferase